jgi:hypothetical protein
MAVKQVLPDQIPLLSKLMIPVALNGNQLLDAPLIEKWWPCMQWKHNLEGCPAGGFMFSSIKYHLQPHVRF